MQTSVKLGLLFFVVGGNPKGSLMGQGKVRITPVLVHLAKGVKQGCGFSLVILGLLVYQLVSCCGNCVCISTGDVDQYIIERPGGVGGLWYHRSTN